MRFQCPLLDQLEAETKAKLHRLKLEYIVDLRRNQEKAARKLKRRRNKGK